MMDKTIDTHALPPLEQAQLRLGYLRLNDSAPLVMAENLGLFDAYGLEVELCREVSWANLRDKLVTGDLDAAQMLSPLPLSTSLGLGGLRAQLCTGLGLSLNGNAITLGTALSAELGVDFGVGAVDARATAQALGHHLRSGQQDRVLTLAASHAFSCHHFQLRLWLQAGGIDPDRDLRIIVLPPEQMVDSLSRGMIDGFCVGEPWNSMAVQQGVGTVHATGFDIWNNGLEKVLAVTQDWHGAHPATHLRLRLALMQACTWLASEENREQAVSVLAHRDYLDMPEEYLRPALTGQFRYSKQSAQVPQPLFHVFGRFQAGFPWRSSGEWLLRQMAATLGREFSDEDVKALVQQTYRTDLYREAARQLQLPSPDSDSKPHNENRIPWTFAPGIELGADYFLH